MAALDETQASWAVSWDLFDPNSQAYEMFLESNAQVQIHNAAINVDGMEAEEMEELVRAQNSFMALKLKELQDYLDGGRDIAKG